MLLAVLIVLNIPVFLLIGWLMFDTGHGFVDTLKSYLTIGRPGSSVCVSIRRTRWAI